MIQVTDSIRLDESEIRERFLRSSGPGGQNVNKVATAVQLRFDIRGSAALTEAVRERLIRLAGNRVTRDGVLIIDADRFRTRERNRADARDRLVRWIRKAAEPVRHRRKTEPTGRSKERRLDEKRLRGGVKRNRKPIVCFE